MGYTYSNQSFRRTRTMLNPKNLALQPGKLQKAPENFLSRDFASELTEQGMDDTRRGFLRNSFFFGSVFQFFAVISKFHIADLSSHSLSVCLVAVFTVELLT